MLVKKNDYESLHVQIYIYQYIYSHMFTVAW